jgi:hypothetical protein
MQPVETSTEYQRLRSNATVWPNRPKWSVTVKWWSEWPKLGGRSRSAHPSGLNTRSVEAGNSASLSAGLRGRATNSPPQFGHLPLRIELAQARQNVHSNEQIRASCDCGGRSRLQHSQLGRSWSMGRFLQCAAISIVLPCMFTPSEADRLAVGTFFRSSEVTVVELVDELPAPEFRARAVGLH